MSTEKQLKRFGDLKIDEQFTLPMEICIAEGTVFQKMDEGVAGLVDELNLHPDTKVEVVE